MDRRENRDLIVRLNRDAQRIAMRFQLRYRAIEAERADVKNRYGVCYDDGTIRIRLRHVTTGQPLKYSSLVNTLCHELAHLRHFNHGPRFKTFYLALLEFARREGIYRPAPQRGRVPHSARGPELPRPRQAAHTPTRNASRAPNSPPPAAEAAPLQQQLNLFGKG